MSPDDGEPIIEGYFTDMRLAEQKSREVGGSVVQCALWMNAGGNYFRISGLERVHVNVPTRAAVLKKLTPAERAALGLE